MTASEDGTVREWSRKDGKLIRELSNDEGVPVTFAGYVDDKHSILVVYPNAMVIWKSDGSKIAVGSISSIGLLREESVEMAGPIVFVSSKGTNPNIAMIDMTLGKLRQTLHIAKDDSVLGLATTDEGKRLVAGTTRGQVALWQGTPLKSVLSFKAHGGPCHIIKFSIDGQELLTIGHDGYFRTWNASNGRLLSEIEIGKGDAYFLHSIPQKRGVALSRSAAMTTYAVSLWRRNQNPASDNIFYRFDIWLTVIFGGLLVWSLLRDRKTFRRFREEAAAKDAA